MPTLAQYSRYLEQFREVAEHATTIHVILQAHMDSFRGNPAIMAISAAHGREFVKSSNLIQEILHDWEQASYDTPTKECP